MQPVVAARPFNATEGVIIAALGRCWNYAKIAEALQITRNTVKTYARDAAKALPGDLPAQMKLALYARRAPLYVYTGALMGRIETTPIAVDPSRREPTVQGRVNIELANELLAASEPTTP